MQIGLCFSNKGKRKCPICWMHEVIEKKVGDRMNGRRSLKGNVEGIEFGHKVEDVSSGAIDQE